MTKYKVGDKVRVRKDLKEGNDYSIYVNKDMEKYRGQIKVVEKADKNYGCDKYELAGVIDEDGDGWHFTNDMLEPLIVSINDLQFGDILTLRNGNKYVFADGYMMGELSSYRYNNDKVEENYNEDLTSADYDGEYNIMKVERKGEAVYERKDIREMTVDEISKALGYEVKVVK